MWFTEDPKKANRVPKENASISCAKERRPNDFETLFMENDTLLFQQGLLKKHISDLQKNHKKEMGNLQERYYSKRDSKIFLDFAHEDLEKEHSELKAEFRKMGRKLSNALHDVSIADTEKIMFKKQLATQKITNTLKMQKLSAELKEQRDNHSIVELKLRNTELKVETAELAAREKQEALDHMDEQLKKTMDEKKHLLEVLASRGINLFEGRTRED